MHGHQNHKQPSVSINYFRNIQEETLPRAKKTFSKAKIMKNQAFHRQIQQPKYHLDNGQPEYNYKIKK